MGVDHPALIPQAIATHSAQRPSTTGRYRACPATDRTHIGKQTGGPTRGQRQDREHPVGVPLSEYATYEIHASLALQELPTERKTAMADSLLVLHLVALAKSHRAPLWIAVVLYAMANADQRGHAELRPGELLNAVAADSSGPVLSRAIGTAVRNGWLREGSNAWHLVLAGPVHRGS